LAIRAVDIAGPSIFDSQLNLVRKVSLLPAGLKVSSEHYNSVLQPLLFRKNFFLPC
jgi:hypothetical protein